MIEFFGVPFDEFARSTEALASVDPRVIRALVRNAATKNNLNNIEEIVVRAQTQAKEFTGHLKGIRSLVGLVEAPLEAPATTEASPVPAPAPSSASQGNHTPSTPDAPGVKYLGPGQYNV